MPQKLGCYFCGRVIEDENTMLMKNVQTGYFASRHSFGSWGKRTAFHPECLEVYHKKETRSNLIALAFIALVFVIPVAIIFPAGGAFLAFCILVTIIFYWKSLNEKKPDMK